MLAKREMAETAIPRPRQENEFAVQARIFQRLRDAGIDIYGELKVPFQRLNRRGNCRFDLVVFEYGNAAGIIETKGAEVSHQTDEGWLGTRQGKSYLEFGLPIVVIYGPDSANLFIADSVLSKRVNWAKWDVRK